MIRHDSIRKTWLFLTAICAFLFVFIGIVMVTVDTRYIQGVQYLLTSALLFIAAQRLRAGKIHLHPKDKHVRAVFPLGFIFMVIGLNDSIGTLMVGMWALGVVLFSMGIFKK